MTEAVATDFLPILAAESPRRSFVVSLHDVAPCTREASARIIEALQRAGIRTTSLLVVPNYHRQGSATEDKNFVSWLRDLEARGYEIVIHGYFHERPRRVDERIKEKFMTRFYTQDEGEFFDLDYDEAFARITRARDEFEAARLSPIGFVAPAWLLNHAGERAARDAGMQYITRIDSVVDLLTDEREVDALPGLQHAFEMASHREPGVECRARAQSRNARAGALEYSSFRFRGSENLETRFFSSSSASFAPVTRPPTAIGLVGSEQIEKRHEPVRSSYSFQV